MEGQAQETVVNASVDAEQAVSTQTQEQAAETQTEGSETVVTEAVDAQKPDNVGEAIKREVERREAKLRQEYEQQVKTAQQAARDAWIAEQGYEWNGKPIRTEAEYKEAVRERELLRQYEDKGLPEEVVQELVEGKKFREQYQQTQQTLEQRQKQEADYQAFVATYPDVKPTDIPEAVWAEVSAGKSLVDAYAKHENQLLKQKLAEYEQKQQIEQQNQANAESSTGSITGKAGDAPTFFTREQVAQMSQAEVDKNYTAIVASMKNWK